MSTWSVFLKGWSFSSTTTDQRVAVRRDGSIAMQSLDPAGQPWAVRLILADGYVIRYIHQERTASRRAATSWQDRPYRRSEPGDSRCISGLRHHGSPEQFAYLGTSRLAGLTVVNYRKNGSGLTWSQELSLAPELDCQMMRLYNRNIPSLLGFQPGYISDWVVTSVQFGPPAEALFTIPAGFAIRDVR